MNNWRKLLTPFEKSYSLEKKIHSPLKTPNKKPNFPLNLMSNLKDKNKDVQTKGGSIKKPKDFVSYLKTNSQRNDNGFSNSNIQILQSQLENLKETLKKKLLEHKKNMSGTQINAEKIYDSQTNGNGDETSNLNRTLETVKNNSINRRKENSLKKILLVSKSLPKNNDETHPVKLKTLKKTEEINPNQEKMTIVKKIKFPSSTEDEFLELMNKSCNTSKKKIKIFSFQIF